MNTFTKVAIAAVVVIAVGTLGLSVLRPPSSSSVGGQPSASPSPSPSPSPTLRATVTPEPPPALTETYTSARFGFSISYPTGWVTRPASGPWIADIPDFHQGTGDIIHDPVLDDRLWIVVASQPLAGRSGEQWVDEAMTGLSSADWCQPPRTQVTVDGAQGGKCLTAAAVTVGDRGYVTYLYAGGDDPAAVAGFDSAYFNDILATLQLQPEDAVDTAASPSA